MKAVPVKAAAKEEFPMKHTISRLISLLLTLCLLTPAAIAEGENSEAAILPELSCSLTGLFVRDNAPYAVSWSGDVYRQEESGWVLMGVMEGNTQRVDLSDGAVWMLERWEDETDERSGYRISMAVMQEGTLGETQLCCDIVWDVNADEWARCQGFVVEGSEAYVLMEDAANYGTQNLYRVNLNSGVAAKLLSGPLTEMQRYKDGLFIARRFSWDEYYGADGSETPPQIVTIDLNTGAVETVGMMTGYADGALTYDAETDEIYFSNSSYVYRAAGSTPERVGYLIPSGMEHEGLLAMVWQGRYYVHEVSGLISGSIDPMQFPERVLRVAHVYEVEELIHAFALEHPDIAIEYVERVPGSADELTRHMQSSAAADVYSCMVDTDFVNLRDKKYMVDLSSSGVLTETVARMDERLTAPLYLDGRLCALPCALGVSVDGFYPGAWEKAGVPLELVPCTYEEMLAFIETWYDDYFEDNRGMELFEMSYDLRSELVGMICILQMLRCQKEGISPTLDDPTVRALLTRLEEIAPMIAEVAPVDEWYDWSEDNALFTAGLDPLPHTWRWSNPPQPMILSLDDETDPVIMAYMGVLTVNPYSGNADIAVELLEYIAQHLPDTLKIALMPEENEPIPYYSEKSIAAWREQVAETERLLADAPEEERAELQAALQWQRELIASAEEDPWAYSPEDIAFYRENIEPYLVYGLSPVFATDQVNTILSRYLDGQLSLDDCIREFDRVVWMIQMENQ